MLTIVEVGYSKQNPFRVGGRCPMNEQNDTGTLAVDNTSWGKTGDTWIKGNR